MPANETLRIFRAGGGDAALARQAVTEVHGHAAVDESALASFLNDPASFLLLAVEGDFVLGSLRGYMLRSPNRPEPQFLLYELDVKPEYRRRGIGSALVKAFTREARNAGAYKQWVVTNESNLAAMATYRSCGYERASGAKDDVVLHVKS